MVIMVTPQKHTFSIFFSEKSTHVVTNQTPSFFDNQTIQLNYVHVACYVNIAQIELVNEHTQDFSLLGAAPRRPVTRVSTL